MNIINQFEKNKTKKRIARGEAGKGGKTAGRGHKGQKSRAGFNLPNSFEGGQSTLIMRSPKSRGGLKVKNNIVTISFLTHKNKLNNLESISKEILLKLNIIKKNELNNIIKIINTNKDFKKINNIDIEIIK